MAEGERTNESSNKATIPGCAWLLLPISVIAAALLIPRLFGPGEGAAVAPRPLPPQPREKELSISTRADTYVMCKHAAVELLLSPASAKWASAWDVQFIGNEAALTIRASVDSQNIYGAMLRGHMTCEVQKIGQSWRLIQVKID